MPGKIIFIMGVSGSGKTTIGRLLAAKINLPFFDGDDLHSSDNKQKMNAGQPLTDGDRKGWLQKINSLVLEKQNSSGAIIVCSALKKAYRDILIEDVINPSWFFLQGSYSLIHERMIKRKDHFMPVNLLLSQFEILEIPAEAFTIDITNQPDEIVNMIENEIQKK